MTRERPLATAIEPYLDRGMTVPQIAKETGYDPGKIRGCLNRMGWYTRVRMIYRSRGRGKITDVFLPTHIHEWLAKQCPAGLRADEMITAIVTDAYNDAMEIGK